MVKFDHEEKTAKLLLKSTALLPQLQEEEHKNPGYILLIFSRSVVFV